MVNRSQIRTVCECGQEVICRNCGVTLNYVPADVKTRTYKDYSGTSDTEKYIQCPACHHEVYVR